MNGMIVYNLLYNIATDGSWYQSYKNNGGTANTYFDYNKGILPAKTKNPVKKFVNKIKDVNEVLEQAQIVDYNKIDVPSLFLVGAGEDSELMRQSQVLYDNFKQRGIDVTLRKFSSESGADAHCQVNNFRLMHYQVFEWLNHIFKKKD